MTTLEERVQEIERRLGVGGGVLGLQVGDEELRATVEFLQRQVGQLRSRETAGNVFGGMIRTEIGPGFSYIGPFQRDLDSSFPLAFTLPIPAYMLRIATCKLKLKPLAIRSSVSTGAPIATQTSSAGGAQTSSGSSDFTTTYKSHTHNTNTTNSGPGITTFSSGHNHGYVAAGASTGGAAASHSHTISSSGSHRHSNAHTHTVDDHTHTVTGHGHSLTLAIAEGAAATQMTLTIDGVDRTSALGGPWDAEVEVEIRDYLVNARQEPVAGVHTFSIGPDTVGAVEVTGEIYCILRPPS